MKKIIAVIENQFSQYEYIHGELEKTGYQVFPEKNGYKEFMDLVRVCCDPRYDEEIRKKKAKELLVAQLKELDVALFIIDFKLSGTWDGMNGIQLAVDIRGQLTKFKHTPVIFLSRTPPNEKEVKMDLPLIENYKWVEKGYAGMSLKESSYFRLHVVDEIKQMTSKVLGDEEMKLAKGLLENKLVYEQKESIRLRELAANGELNSNQRKIIRDLDLVVNRGQGTDKIIRLLKML